MRLNQVLSREKELKKSLKYRTKSLKKNLKKAQKDNAQLSGAQINEELEEILDAVAQYFAMGATRTWADATARADVVVDGQPVVADVPVPYLILAEKQLKYLRDLVRYLPLSVDSTRLDHIGARIEKLHNAVRFARQEANASLVEQPSYGEAMMDYVLHGRPAEEKAVYARRYRTNRSAGHRSVDRKNRDDIAPDPAPRLEVRGLGILGPPPSVHRVAEILPVFSPVNSANRSRSTPFGAFSTIRPTSLPSRVTTIKGTASRSSGSAEISSARKYSSTPVSW